METVWERRRLKRETLEPEDMHTVRGGGISALAHLGPWDLPDISEALSPVPVWLIGHWPRYTCYSYFTVIYLKPALVLLLHVCLFPLTAWASCSSINRILSSIH